MGLRPIGGERKKDERQHSSQEPWLRLRARLATSGERIRTHWLARAPAAGDQLAAQHRAPRSDPVELEKQARHFRPKRGSRPRWPWAPSTTRIRSWIPATTGRIPRTRMPILNLASQKERSTPAKPSPRVLASGGIDTLSVAG